MAEPADMIVPMLRELREDIRGFREEAAGEFKSVNDRLERIEGRQKSFNHAMTADTMLAKLVTGDFEERIEALEKKMNDLMKGRQ